MEHHVAMKFLVNEGVKPVDIYRRLQAQYGDETLSHSKTFEWCKRFKDGRMSVSDDPGHGDSQPTAVMASTFWDNVALFMWIFYPVVPLSTVNITVVF